MNTYMEMCVWKYLRIDKLKLKKKIVINKVNNIILLQRSLTETMCWTVNV